MVERVWDRFLTDRDKEHLAASPPTGRYGFGRSAAVLSVDNYRKAVGDRPEPLLEAIKTWPGSTGLDGWTALEKTVDLLEAARTADIPVIHVTALAEEDSGLTGWGARLGGRHRSEPRTSEEEDRHRRRLDIVEQAAPLPGEVVLRKAGPSAFFGTPLAAHLIGAGVDTLIVCGESVSGCVRSTVVDGCSLRLRMIVVEDCVYDRHEASSAINLFDMDRKYADVISLAEVTQWIADSTGAVDRRAG
ncbi:isochorismatase family protein [Actinotalea sp. Marseille-Q4924]|uniref:isochorismatase family protein n=1 Tax=Actinotalea sp. Marseille-Q4924 TaxID=2866571 RepID=UPI001CE3D787|nr:isochorismatase family protein [Actinotalea sp. Marseille-Q4924]